MRCLEVYGTSGEIGEAIGESFRERILEYIEYRFHQIHDEFLSLGVAFDRKDYYKLSAQLQQSAMIFAPEEYQELSGVSRAVNIPFVDALFSVGYTDIFDLLLSHAGKLSSSLFDINAECTTFLYSKNHKLLLGQNWDMDEGSAQNWCLLTKHYSDGAVIKGLSTVLGLIHIGMNDNGIFVGTANLSSNRCTSTGLLFPMIIQRILRSAFITEIIDWIKTVKKVGGHYYYCAQKNNKGIFAYSIECDAADCVIRKITDGAVAHSNHYKEEAFSSAGIVYSADTLMRNEFMERELARQDVGIEMLKEALSNHSNNICRHSKPNQLSETCTSVIYDGNQNEMHVCNTNPCTGRWVTIRR